MAHGNWETEPNRRSCGKPYPAGADCCLLEPAERGVISKDCLELAFFLIVLLFFLPDFLTEDPRAAPSAERPAEIEDFDISQQIVGNLGVEKMENTANSQSRKNRDESAYSCLTCNYEKLIIILRPGRMCVPVKTTEMLSWNV